MSTSDLPPWAQGGVPRGSKPEPLSEADLLVREKTREHCKAIIRLIQDGLSEMERCEDCPEDWQALVMAYMIEDVNDLRVSLIALLEAERARLLGEAERRCREAGQS